LSIPLFNYCLSTAAVIRVAIAKLSEAKLGYLLEGSDDAV
jgi:hypothetical protein